MTGFTGVEINDPRLEAVLSVDFEPVILHQFTLHGEGTVWDTPRDRLVWSDVPNRRLLGWYPDGRVEVVIDNTQFMNGNALDRDGRLVHCEHGLRCISRSDGDGTPDPIVAHYEGRRLNSPDDVTVTDDGAIVEQFQMAEVCRPSPYRKHRVGRATRPLRSDRDRLGSRRRLADQQAREDRQANPAPGEG